MPAGGEDSYPLPKDPTLAEVASALRDTGHWALVFDDQWRVVYVTDDLRLTFGGLGERAAFPLGKFAYGPEFVSATKRWRFGTNTTELTRALFAALGGLVLTDTLGGRDELRERADASFHDLIDDLVPADAQAMLSCDTAGSVGVGTVNLPMVAVRIRDRVGKLTGTAVIAKPPAGMSTIAWMTVRGDPRHLERMQRVTKPSRRPAAILFADLEGSTPLSRRLSTASYFALGRRLVQAADQCIIDAGGLAGRHVGDGVAAFFLADTADSESAAARECIAAARALTVSVRDVAVRSELQPQDVVLNFGLHWGSTLYVGNITTGARAEITALGDEVNEAARIEACATGGRALASKVLIERLDRHDATALGIDPDRINYTQLANLTTATEKARRDAPAIAVCDVLE